jgi:hypothetical protein
VRSRSRSPGSQGREANRPPRTETRFTTGTAGSLPPAATEENRSQEARAITPRVDMGNQTSELPRAVTSDDLQTLQDLIMEAMQETSGVRRRVGELTTQVAAMVTAHKEMQARITKLEEDPKGRPSNQPAWKVWAYTDLANIGERYFDLFENPRSDNNFVMWIKDEKAYLPLSDCPPLSFRTTTIRTGMQRNAFALVRRWIAEGAERPPFEDLRTLLEVFCESIITFILLEPGAKSPVTFKVLLNFVGMDRKAAKGMGEKSYREDTTPSTITNEIRGKGTAVVLGFNPTGFPFDVICGEAIKGIGHWQNLASQVGTPLLASCVATAAPPTQSVSPCYRVLPEGPTSTIGPGDSISNVAKRRPRVYVADRCQKCLGKSHRGKDCPAPRPDWNPERPGNLLTRAANGEIPLPP